MRVKSRRTELFTKDAALDMMASPTTLNFSVNAACTIGVYLVNHEFYPFAWRTTRVHLWATSN